MTCLLVRVQVQARYVQSSQLSSGSHLKQVCCTAAQRKHAQVWAVLGLHANPDMFSLGSLGSHAGWAGGGGGGAGRGGGRTKGGGGERGGGAAQRHAGWVQLGTSGSG